MKIEIKYFVYEKRMQRNLSSRRLAELSGISHTEINNIENGKKHPSLMTMCMIAAALETDPLQPVFIRNSAKLKKVGNYSLHFQKFCKICVSHFVIIIRDT